MRKYPNKETRDIDGSSVLVHPGPLLQMLDETSASDVKGYRERGGFSTLMSFRENSEPHVFVKEINSAGLKGRGGGGFPTGHKWWLVHRKVGAKYFVCNAHTGHPGNFKDRLLVQKNPYAVIEATMLACWAIGADMGFICLPYDNQELIYVLQKGVEEVEAFSPQTTLHVVPTYGDPISGEETALLELLEGKKPKPRRKPCLPTENGLFSKPTVVNNIETLLQTFLIAREGARKFLSIGTEDSPGTMLFSVSGNVVNPGVFELPLGTSLERLIHEYAGGPLEKDIQLVFPSGPTSPPLGRQDLGVALDYESMRSKGSELGTGNVIVIDDDVPTALLTTYLAEYFHRYSCGKCQPCHDGTGRVVTMLRNLDKIDAVSVDLDSNRYPEKSLRYVNTSSSRTVYGASYTDMLKGIEKIDGLCEFFKYRGDCRWSQASALTIQKCITFGNDNTTIIDGNRNDD